MLARASLAGLWGLACRRALQQGAQSCSSAVLIDGKAISNQIRAEMRAEVAELGEQCGVRPGLAVVLVGARKDSVKYVTMKQKGAEELGYRSVKLEFAENTAQHELEHCIDRLNADGEIHGILIQLPLPTHIDQHAVLNRVDADKDVDGFHNANMGHLARLGEQLRHARRPFHATEARNAPCTPLGASCACTPPRVPRAPDRRRRVYGDALPVWHRGGEEAGRGARPLQHRRPPHGPHAPARRRDGDGGALQDARHG